MQVGSNLKSPKYPIWVVCSESHFSVLFSMKRSLVNERSEIQHDCLPLHDRWQLHSVKSSLEYFRRSQKKFDLYYYDGLAGQNEEIRLTIGKNYKLLNTLVTYW
jgi:hypothetical protein